MIRGSRVPIRVVDLPGRARKPAMVHVRTTLQRATDGQRSFGATNDTDGVWRTSMVRNLACMSMPASAACVSIAVGSSSPKIQFASAPTFCSSSATLLAPTSTDVTRSSCSTYASAIGARVWPRPRAISFGPRTEDNPSLLNRFGDSEPSCVAREPSGMPPRSAKSAATFPVVGPRAVNDSRSSPSRRRCRLRTIAVSNLRPGPGTSICTGPSQPRQQAAGAMRSTPSNFV